MRRATLLLLAPLLLSGCDTSNYAFKVDESIDIVEPAARADVSLPVTLRWTDERPPTALRVAPKDPTAEYYAVFLDRAALGPGKRLASLVDDKDLCRQTPGCPSVTQLSDLRVFLTATPSLLVEFVADRRASKRGDSKDVHEVAVVRMRGDKRVGEAAFLQTFFVKR
ncbi:MAG: hypothetical protein M3P04_04740 [Actinomycetota bacterium]|nr:hypothetical protein [Actinomycetota bacterium]